MERLSAEEPTEESMESFEELFGHRQFTGRSGTFFAYEGLGSIYWHMVSKLGLAVFKALPGGAAFDMRVRTTVLDGQLVWRGGARLALFPLESLAEPALPGLPARARLIVKPLGDRLLPGSRRLHGSLATVVVEPVAPQASHGFAWWTAAAFALGLLAFNINILVNTLFKLSKFKF